MESAELYVHQILPGILEKDWVVIEQKLELLKPFAKVVHIDLLDGKFAPNTSFLDPKPFKKYAKNFILELHMMVDNPIQYIKPFAEAGFQRFLGHIEKMPAEGQAAFVAEAEQYGEVGLAVDGPTPIDAITVPYDDIDSILIMTIKAGFSGQKFMTEHLDKVKFLRDKGVTLPIEVDGGVNAETAQYAKDVGVQRFVTTSYLFGSPNPEAQFKSLQKTLGIPEKE